MNFFQVTLGEFTTIPKVLFYIGEFPVTSTMTTGVFLNILLILFIVLIARHFTESGTPSRFQLALEGVYAYILDLVEKISGEKSIAKNIIHIILTIMIYIGVANILLLLPFIGGLTFEDKILFETTTKDLNITFGIALTVVVWTHFASIRKFNLWVHLNKFIKITSFIQNVRKGKINILIAFIDLFLGLLDIVSEFARSLSLALRLFGNMFAGEVLGALIMSLFALILPVPIMFYSIFSGVLQALVFGALSASYFGGALKD